MRTGLPEYLSALQQATTWTGLSEFCQSHRRQVPHERTVRRWHKQLGSSVSVFPVFAVEGLGLSHLHAFLFSPEPERTTFPYAVESAMVSTDGLSDVLYLHCIVPKDHLAAVKGRLRAVCRNVEFLESLTGWERCGLPIDSPPSRAWIAPDRALLQQHPYVVPAIFEAFGEMQSLDAIWKRTKSRLGSSLCQYFPAQRYYPTNGKLHVKQAYETLSAAGLFSQFVVRQQLESNVEAFVLMDPQCTEEFLQTIRRECSMLAVHPSEEGSLLRLAGNPRVFDSLLNCEKRLYWVNRAATNARTPKVRFAYESLFRPASAEWILPEAPP